ncbi:hypothetical protein [Acinetobacter sp.]|uniref:hypothetical protein n=1 Tax=Acinetobacter sp. TaxID=472 RepID=UPI00388F3CD1
MKTLKYLISISWMPLALLGWTTTGLSIFLYVLWGFVGISAFLSICYIIHAFVFPPSIERLEIWRKAAHAQPFKRHRLFGLIFMALMVLGLFRYVNNIMGTLYLLSVIMLQAGRAKLIGRL